MIHYLSNGLSLFHHLLDTPPLEADRSFHGGGGSFFVSENN